MVPYALIFGGWGLAAVLSQILGAITNYSVLALIFCLCIGSGSCVLAVVLS